MLINRKEIWFLILQYICHRHRLFLPSYPVDDMSLTQIQLAALGPYRWYRSIKRHHGLCEAGDDRMPLRPNSKTPVVVDPSHKMRFLIPGGRFILTADNISIALWDIGVVGCLFKSPPRRIARTEISNKDVNNLKIYDVSVQQVKEDLLRVAISSIQSDLMYVLQLLNTFFYWSSVDHLSMLQCEGLRYFPFNPTGSVHRIGPTPRPNAMRLCLRSHISRKSVVDASGSLDHPTYHDMGHF
jgi:hypothetical protein